MSNDQLTETFIEKVKLYRVLYDLKHAEYKNLRKKDKIWDLIGLEFKMEGDEAKKKWKNLRDTYTRYTRSTKTTTGQAALKLQSPWVWAKQMEFLKPFMSFAKTIDNNIRDIPSRLVPPPCDFDEITNRTPPATSNVVMETEQNLVPIVDNETADVACSPAKKQKKDTSSVNKVIDYLKNKPQKNKSKETMDELEYLFMGHAKSVKKLSARRQAIIKIKIAQIIAEKEMEQIDEEMGKNISRDEYSTVSDDIFADDIEFVPNTLATDNLPCNGNASYDGAQHDLLNDQLPTVSCTGILSYESQDTPLD